MKSAFIDFISCVIVITGASLYQRFALIPNLSFEWQAFWLFLLVGAFELIYRYTQTHITQVYVSSLKGYLIALCLAGIALGSFSLSELNLLGFNFAPSESKAVQQYFVLKTLFFAVSVIFFPKLFGEKP